MKQVNQKISIPATAFLASILALAFSPLSAGAEFPQSSKPAATSSTIRVVVEGVGTTREEALRSAFRAAVRHVVGTLVDSETRIEDGKLIYDRVLTHSEGYIARYEVLDQRTEGPLFHQKIAALVRRDSLGRRLGMTTVDAARLDGPTLFARATSQHDREASAAEQLAVALARFPIEVAQVRLASGAEVVNRSSHEITLSQPLLLGVDAQRYAKARARLLQLLELAAQERGTFCAQMGATKVATGNVNHYTIGAQFSGMNGGESTYDKPADMRLATEYAIDSLCGLLIGDEVSWKGGSRTFSSDSFKAFKEIAKDDPLNAATPADIERLDQQRAEFLVTVQRTDAYRSARNGRVPPGTIIRTWNDEHWVYAMAVYAPSWTDLAGRIALDMKSSSLLRPYGDAASKAGSSQSPLNPALLQPAPQAADQPRPRPRVELGPKGRLKREEL